MLTHLNHPARRKPTAELSDWVLDVAVLVLVVAVAAIVLSYAVLLILT